MKSINYKYLSIIVGIGLLAVCGCRQPVSENALRAYATNRHCTLPAAFVSKIILADQVVVTNRFAQIEAQMRGVNKVFKDGDAKRFIKSVISINSAPLGGLDLVVPEWELRFYKRGNLIIVAYFIDDIIVIPTEGNVEYRDSSGALKTMYYQLEMAHRRHA